MPLTTQFALSSPSLYQTMDEIVCVIPPSFAHIQDPPPCRRSKMVKTLVVYEGQKQKSCDAPTNSCTKWSEMKLESENVERGLGLLEKGRKETLNR